MSFWEIYGITREVVIFSQMKLSNLHILFKIDHYKHENKGKIKQTNKQTIKQTNEQINKSMNK